MKWLFLGVLLLLAFSSLRAQPLPAGMTVSVDVSAADVAVLLRELPRVNARERRDELPFTLEIWLETMFERQIRSLVGQGKQADQSEACARWHLLPEAAQRSLLPQFGDVSPCP